MGINFKFDAAGNPFMPTVILARHSGTKLGSINRLYNLKMSDSLKGCPEMSFTVNKDEEPLWDNIVDFKLIYVIEWNTWLQIKVDIVDSERTSKEVSATGLCKSELSQILLHGFQFNTEDDIARDDYERRVIYDPENLDNSILPGIFDKAPHYRIAHVDSSIASLYKVFTFDGVALDDAVQQICTECDAVAIYNDGSDETTGMPIREVSFYDLETICLNCGHRGDFSDVCPECGGTNLRYGYGVDTTIFVSTKNLTESVKYTSDVDSIKNTFKLVAGDDIMTSAIQACNPNGTDYIHFINQDTKDDMSNELVAKIDEYDAEYEYYQNDYAISLDENLISDYNSLVDEYRQYDSEIPYLPVNLTGFPTLMNIMYDVIDFEYYVQTSLVPSDDGNETTAQLEADKLTRDNLSPVGIDESYNNNKKAIDNMVLGVARFIVDKRYDVRIKTSLINETESVNYWVGSFTVTSYANETISVDSEEVFLVINTETETYLKQRLKKFLASTDTKDYSTSHMIDDETTPEELEVVIGGYSIDLLHTMSDTCMSCMDTLQEKGAADKTSDMYSDLYMIYYEKWQIIMAEITRKEAQIATIESIKEYVANERATIQSHLNFEDYLGETLWKEFCSYRREDIYTNEYFISDGLNNEQIFENARDFYETAKKEIYKSAVLQHSISSTLKNLLVIPEFEPLRDSFELGNWLRIEVDGSVYRLRLIQYGVDFGDLSEVSVAFSDVTKTADGITDLEDLLNRTSSMASSYGAVVRQIDTVVPAKTTVNSWLTRGLDASLTRIVNDDGRQDVVIDNHGVLVRSYDDVTETYSDTQMKFINSILAITDDNWESIKTAIGNIIYEDPISGQLQDAYGIIAETLVGDLILGRTLRIHNESNNMIFDEDGLYIYNAVNSFTVNPNDDDMLLALSRYDEPMLWVDYNGVLHIKGDGAGLDISANSSVTGLQTQFTVEAGAIRGEITNVNNSLTSLVSQTADQFYVNLNSAVNGLDAKLSVTADKIQSQVTDSISGARSSFEQTAGQILMRLQTDEDFMTNLSSTFSMTAGEIRLEVSNYFDNTNSIISQTADSIRSEVNNIDAELRSYIQQTVDKIELSVQNDVTNVYSKLELTDNEIRSMVNNEVAKIGSLMSQTDSMIRLFVYDELDKMSSAIEQTSDSLRFYVHNELTGVNSAISVNADKIESIVASDDVWRTRITQTIDSIALVTGGGSGATITLTDATINEVARLINLRGLVTISGLDSSTRSKVNNAITEEEARALITSGSGAVYYSDTEPSGTFYEGDIWYQKYTDGDTNNVKMRCYIYSGSGWTQHQSGEVVIQNGTVVADLIASGAISTEKLATDSIKSLNFPENGSTDGGSYSSDGTFLNLSNGTLTSKNIRIDSNGDLHIKGAIEAGSIGDLVIEYGNIIGYRNDSSSTFMMLSCSENDAIFIGDIMESETVPFTVSWNGEVGCNTVACNSISTLGITTYGDISCESITVNGTVFDGAVSWNELSDIPTDLLYVSSSDADTLSIVDGQSSPVTYTLSKDGHTHSNYVDTTTLTNDYWTITQVKSHQLRHSQTNTTMGYYTFRQDDGTTTNAFYVEYHNPSSDERLKNIISSFDNRYYNFFMDLNPMIYKWKDGVEFNDDKYHWGFSAQEFEATAKKYGIIDTFDYIIGYDNENDRYLFNSKEIFTLNWYVTQQNGKVIEELQNRIRNLENEIALLKS